METYFGHVLAAQEKIFGQVRPVEGVNMLTLAAGDLSLVERGALASMMESDYFIVFGASYIKGWLIDALIERDALNIHMGISPYYRGSSCNFWALYDGRPELVGATIHKLSKGLDSGKMLRHVQAHADGMDNPFEYTMNAVKLTHEQLLNDISHDRLGNFEPVAQDKSRELRYSRNKEFTDAVAREYLDRGLGMDSVRARLDAQRQSGRFLDWSDPES